jgi:hypothetical protein
MCHVFSILLGFSGDCLLNGFPHGSPGNENDHDIVMIRGDKFKTNYKRERVKVSNFFAEMLY